MSALGWVVWPLLAALIVALIVGTIEQERKDKDP